MTPKIRSTPRARGEASNLSKTLFVFFLSVRSSGMMLRNWLSWFKKTSWGPRGSLSTGWPPPPCPPQPPTLPQSPFKPSNVLPATLACLSAARKFIARNKTWQELWMASFVAFYVVHNCQKYQVVSPRDTLMTNDVSQGHGDTHLGLRCLCPTVYSWYLVYYGLDSSKLFAMVVVKCTRSTFEMK